MFGFIIGTACLIGFIAVWRHHGHRRFGRRAYWWFFQKLDTSPGQERVVRNAIESVKESARGFAQGGKASRRELADMLRAPQYERERVSDWFMAREEEFRRFRENAVGALGEVHEVLDDRQREKLAEIVERGACWPGHWRGHGPYRSQNAEAS